VVPILLAEAAIRNGIKLVHISSGCIFNYDYKDLPIDEEHRPDFFDLYYSRTKIYAETALYSLSNAANILQLRIRMPIDYEPHPKNLLTKLINYPTVIDIPNSITYIPDFLEMAKHLIAKDAEGIYNCTNYGAIKHREILEEYRKYAPNHQYAIMEVAELKLVRTNLILSTDKLEESGFPVRDIHDVIPECVEKYVQCLKK
jgi:nucleoside-diphosphate-sugar epimerase